METTFKTGVQSMDFDLVTSWLQDVFWSPGITKAEVICGAQNSSLVVGGFDAQGRQVSYMRVVSDKVRFAYLIDVVVAPGSRRRGIGRRMVKFAMEDPEMAQVYQWVLRTRDAQGVYAALGFRDIEGPDHWMVVEKPRGKRANFGA